MKFSRSLSLLSVLAVGALQQSKASGLAVDFSTAQGYVGGNSSLAGQQGWVTNDPLNGDESAGDTSFVHFVAGYTPGSSGAGNNSVLFGGAAAADGYYPGRPDPNLSKSFTTPINLADSLKTTAFFSTDFAIIDSSDPSFPAEDTFGFDLRNSVGASLAAFKFNPATAVLSDLGFQWYLNGTLQTTANPSLNGDNEIGYAAKYRFTAALKGSEFSAWISALNSSNEVVSTALVILNGDISGSLVATDFTDVAITWNLSDTTQTDPGVYGNAGSNYIIDNSISVTAVPEPSTYLIAVCLIGFVGFRCYRHLNVMS